MTKEKYHDMENNEESESGVARGMKAHGNYDDLHEQQKALEALCRATRTIERLVSEIREDLRDIADKQPMYDELDFLDDYLNND